MTHDISAPPAATGTPPPEEGRLASRWLMRQSRRASLPMGVAIAAPLIAGVLLLPQAWLLASVLQRAIVEHAAPASLIGPLMLICGLMAARALLARFGESAGARAAETIQLDVRRDLFRQLMAKRPEWTAARPSGALAAALVEEVAALHGFFSRYLPALIAATVLPIGFSVLLLPVDWVVGLLFLVTCPLIPIFMALVGWGAEAANQQHQQALLRLSGFFADRLRGLMTLKLFGRGEAEAEKLGDIGDDLRRRTLGVLRIAFLSSAVLEFFAALGVAGVALYIGLTYLGFVSVHGGAMSLATGLFCLLMAPEVYFPLRQFAAHYHDRAAAKSAAIAIAELFEALPEGLDSESVTGTDAVRLERATPVSISRLQVRAPSGRTLLHDIDLAIPRGAHIGLIGESGSGKSTLLETLARLRGFDGQILLGGMSLGDFEETALRQRVAMLGQRPRLYAGSIAENIRFGRPDADDASVMEAARRAGVMRFAAALPDGLASFVGEGGIGLSGGEAHRVALARIYLRDPALILLDEPTAHLDPETEAAVIDGILEFAAGRTLVLATHSLAVASRLDRVYRVAGGSVLPVPSLRPNVGRIAERGAA